MPQDFNGDGHPDILWENTRTGQCAIWFMNGTKMGSVGMLGVDDTVWTMRD